MPSIKRKLAESKVKARRRQASKHEKEMKKLGLQRNKTLKEAKVAAERAEAYEKKRKAEEEKARVLAPITKARREAAMRRKAKAQKLAQGTQKALKATGKS